MDSQSESHRSSQHLGAGMESEVRSSSLLSSTLLRDSQLRVEIVKGKSIFLKEQVCRAKLMWEVGAAKFKRNLCLTLVPKSSKGNKDVRVDGDDIRAFTPCDKFPLEASAAFSMHTKKKVYHCVADKEDDMLGWVASLQAALEESRVQEGAPLVYHVSVIDSPASKAHGECLMEFHPRWQPHSLVFRTPLTQVVVYSVDISAITVFGYSSRTAHMWIRGSSQSQIVLRINGVTAAHVARVLRTHVEAACGQLDVNDQLAKTDRITFTVPGSSETAFDTPGAVLRSNQSGDGQKSVHRSRYDSAALAPQVKLPVVLRSKSEDGEYENMSELPCSPQLIHGAASAGSQQYQTVHESVEEVSDDQFAFPPTQQSITEMSIDDVYDNSTAPAKEESTEYDHLVEPHLRGSRPPQSPTGHAGRRRRSVSSSPTRYDHLFGHLDEDGRDKRYDQSENYSSTDRRSFDKASTVSSLPFQRMKGVRSRPGMKISTSVKKLDSRKARKSLGDLHKPSSPQLPGDHDASTKRWSLESGGIEEAGGVAPENMGYMSQGTTQPTDDLYETAFDEPPKPFASRTASSYEVAEDHLTQSCHFPRKVEAAPDRRLSLPTYDQSALYEVAFDERSPDQQTGDLDDIYEVAVDEPLQTIGISDLSASDSEDIYEVASDQTPSVISHVTPPRHVVESIYEVDDNAPPLQPSENDYNGASQVAPPSHEPESIYEVAENEPPPLPSENDCTGAEPKSKHIRHSMSAPKLPALKKPKQPVSEVEQEKVPSPRSRQPPPLPSTAVRPKPPTRTPPVLFKPSTPQEHNLAGRRHSQNIEAPAGRTKVHFTSTMGNRLMEPTIHVGGMMRARSDSDLSAKDEDGRMSSLIKANPHYGSSTFSDCDEDYITLDVIRSRSPVQVNEFTIVNGDRHMRSNWSPAPTPEGISHPAWEASPVAVESKPSVAQPPVPKPRISRKLTEKATNTIPQATPAKGNDDTRSTQSLPAGSDQMAQVLPTGTTRKPAVPRKPPRSSKPIVNTDTVTGSQADTATPHETREVHGKSVAAKAQFLEAHLDLAVFRMTPAQMRGNTSPLPVQRRLT